MKKFWLVCWNEYKRHVFRKRFIMVILSLPLMLLLMSAIAVLAVALDYDGRPVGYVDTSGWFAHAYPLPAENTPILRPPDILAFPNEGTAKQALSAGKIQGYFVIHRNYITTGEVTLVAPKKLDSTVTSRFSDFLRQNLVHGQPENVQRLINDGPNFVARAPDRSRQVAENDWLSLALPIAAGILFVVVVNMSGGYLLQAVVEEKENRTMEIVVTSVSPNQLMAGKAVGNLSVGLTQLAIWLAFPLLFFLVMRSRLPFLQDLHVQPQLVWITALTLLAAFIMVAALMSTVGATTTESREAQQVSGMFTLPLVAPYWFAGSVLTQPNSLLVRILSYFPLTAPATLPMRAASTTLPTWEIVLSLALLYLAAFGSIWLAGRAFRLGMLRYGKVVSWRELFRRSA